MLERPQLSADLHLGEIAFTLWSNSEILLECLSTYYAGIPQSKVNTQIELWLWDTDLDLTLPSTWHPVPRESGKNGQKEAYADTSDGRWIRKLRTGMHFLQRLNGSIAIGPCQENISQLVNFINNQWINHYVNTGYLLGHAAAFESAGEVIAIAASSGGGKSTLMLSCLEQDNTRFLTNDRLLFTPDYALGVPKWPRVNPGTLLHSGRLLRLLPQDYQTTLKTLSRTELWTIEDKYDVPIETHYGQNRIALTGKLRHLVMLDWQFDTNQETQLIRTNQHHHIDGLRKSTGPFYIDLAGSFQSDPQPATIDSYLSQLGNTTIWRLTGKVDFDAATRLVLELTQ